MGEAGGGTFAGVPLTSIGAPPSSATPGSDDTSVFVNGRGARGDRRLDAPLAGPDGGVLLSLDLGLKGWARSSMLIPDGQSTPKCTPRLDILIWDEILACLPHANTYINVNLLAWAIQANPDVSYSGDM